MLYICTFIIIYISTQTVLCCTLFQIDFHHIAFKRGRSTVNVVGLYVDHLKFSESTVCNKFQLQLECH